MTLYFISGLGADERIFENLQLPSIYTIRHIHWIEPYPEEPLASYCKRLSEQITEKEDFLLIGLSFGGLVAVELSKILTPKQVILLSSISCRQELPSTLRFINLLKLYRIVPSFILKWHHPIADWLFGARTKREKELLRSFLKQVTPNYLKWSIHQVLNWKQEKRERKIFHIHGSSDRIFLPGRIKADVFIEKGQHMMVHEKGKQIGVILAEHLKKLA